MRRVLRGIAWVVGGVVLLIGGYLVYASATVTSRMAFPDTPFPQLAASQDPAVIERGRYLAHGPAHCNQCHSVDDRNKPELVKGDVPLSGGLEFAMGPIATTWAANLTPDPETGIGKRSDGEIARTLRSGVLANGQLSIFMRYSVARLSDEDLVAVLSYLRSRPPVKRVVRSGEWGILGKAMAPLMSLGPPKKPPPTGVQPGPEPSVTRGEYLAEHVALCVGCHSAFEMKTFENIGPKAAGGNVDVSHGDDRDMEFAPPNLTSDPTGYTGRTDEDSFVKRLLGGRAIASSIMPWEGFSQMSEADARSIYRYLKSLPAVKNDTGPTYRKIGWKPAK
jgi:mono/diheme cytochrome c family protein